MRGAGLGYEGASRRPVRLGQREDALDGLDRRLAAELDDESGQFQAASVVRVQHDGHLAHGCRHRREDADVQRPTEVQLQPPDHEAGDSRVGRPGLAEDGAGTLRDARFGAVRIGVAQGAAVLAGQPAVPARNVSDALHDALAQSGRHTVEPDVEPDVVGIGLPQDY